MHVPNLKARAHTHTLACTQLLQEARSAMWHPALAVVCTQTQQQKHYAIPRPAAIPMDANGETRPKTNQMADGGRSRLSFRQSQVNLDAPTSQKNIGWRMGMWVLFRLGIDQRPGGSCWWCKSAGRQHLYAIMQIAKQILDIDSHIPRPHCASSTGGCMYGLSLQPSHGGYGFSKIAAQSARSAIQEDTNSDEASQSHAENGIEVWKRQQQQQQNG